MKFQIGEVCILIYCRLYYGPPSHVGHECTILDFDLGEYQIEINGDDTRPWWVLPFQLKKRDWRNDRHIEIDDELTVD
jgi:hypothetical protein